MYSLVLMAAVGAGPVAPSAGPVGGCYGGCTGAYAGCSGYSSCHGCYGSCHGRGFLGHHKRNGCNGCNGCRGGGLFGHHKRSGCHGCSGSSCHGCFGSSCHGCFGSSCYGSGYGCSGAFAGCWGSCHGCFGGYAYPAYPTIPPAVVAPYGIRPVQPEPKPETKPEAKPEKKKSSDSDNSASLKFELPGDAVLFVDGRQTPGQGRERTFITPPLAAGQKFFYDVRAEVVVGGVTVVEEKRVIVEAGANLTESFPKLTAAVAVPTTVAGR